MEIIKWYGQCPWEQQIKEQQQQIVHLLEELDQCRQDELEALQEEELHGK